MSYAETEILDLTDAEIDNVSGAVVPLVAVGIAFGKGVVAGAGAAAAVHTVTKFVKLLTS